MRKMRRAKQTLMRCGVKHTLVDVGRVCLLPGLGALLLLARRRGRLLASLLLLSGSLSSRGLAAGGGSLLGLWWHFESVWVGGEVRSGGAGGRRWG